MARGKTKFRDIVGKKKSKPSKIKLKSRKTYSLHKNNKSKKKKFDYKDVKELEPKDVKKFEPKKREIYVSEMEANSESDHEEIEDDFMKLRNTFSNNFNNKQSLAIETDDDDSSVEDNLIINKETSDENETSSEISVNEEEDDENYKNTKHKLTEDEKVEDANDNSNDPFVKHFSYDLHDCLLNSVQNYQKTCKKYAENWHKLGNLSIEIPYCDNSDFNNLNSNSFSIEQKKPFASCGSIPNRICMKSVNFLADLHIKTRIVGNFKKANKSLEEDTSELFTPLQNELFSIINSYQDLYFSQRTLNNSEEIMYCYCLHAVNHMLKTRTKILHHTARLVKKTDVPEEFRDQGLVRPKILIILPFKHSAYKVICTLINILFNETKGNVMNKSRFIEEYTGNEIIMPKRNPKPEDYEQTFAGNTNDEFKIGLKITKKKLKLFADFYSSDIIVASPLGLRTIIGAEGEEDRDYDFLASIELLIFDQTELFLMQNWDHVIHILNHMHLQPKNSHGIDFSRVRTWSLNGWAKYYRQTLIFSSLMLPEINSIFNKKCTNYSGKVKIINKVELGSINQVFVQLPHVFHKFNVSNVSEAIDERFNFFINNILPQQQDTLMRQTLVFISNYFDYVRLRNYFKKEDISFVQICEYSKEGKIARARDMFYHGDAHFLLYTERYHFFNRIRIKGIRHLVFYQPPIFPHFYYELSNLMQENNMNKKIGNDSNMTITVLYSKYDINQIAAIVGTDRAAKMMQSNRNVHLIVTSGGI